MRRGPAPEMIAAGAIAGAIALVIAYVNRPGEGGRTMAAARSGQIGTLAAVDVHPVIDDGRAAITVRSLDGAFARDLHLSIVVDGVARPVTWRRGPSGANGIVLDTTVDVGNATEACALTFRFDPKLDALTMALTVDASAGASHSYALRAELSTEGDPVFVSGVGHVADQAHVSGPALVLEAAPHPLGVSSSAGTITVDALVDAPTGPSEPMRLAITSPPVTLPASAGAAGQADLFVVLGESSARIWRSLYAVAGTEVGRVRGRVSGTTERARVHGCDAQGNVLVAALAEPDGTFELDAPPAAAFWYAALDAVGASPVVPFTPGAPEELVLDVAPVGELKVTIRDPDTNAPITARLLVRGLDGTVDPNFGPDYRASGAGPVIDAHRGHVVTPLPAGKYRVAATKGIEWSIDAKVVQILPGHTSEIELAPRHVVPTPGIVGCDLHVHARPSFDSPVSTEDRVLSLVSAGIEFAVPTEHNVVGDYRAAIEALGFEKELASVSGVEITTVQRPFGHFGVFPYPLDQKVPPYRHTNPNAVFDAVRAGDPSHQRYFQVHHPRLQRDIGYFDAMGFDPKSPKPFARGRWDFDGVEVFNGYDSEFPERVDAVLADYWALLALGRRYVATGSSDSHRIQFHWAGYPRTLVWLDAAHAGDDGGAVDPMAVVAAIKKGHTLVTSGPVIEFDIDGVRPGEELTTADDPVRGHLRVRAAPWIDVTKAEVIVGGRVVRTFEMASIPTAVGEEPGSLEEAQARTTRLDVDVTIPVGPRDGWVQVVVRGTRRMDDILPFMPVPPFAFTNPIYIARPVVTPARGGSQ